jgi:heme-degrading monooxygenase HmoA
VAAAAGRPGFVAVQVAAPVEEPHRRVIIGTWESREHWAAWHEDEDFRRTRAELEIVDERTTDSSWYDVITFVPHD